VKGLRMNAIAIAAQSGLIIAALGEINKVQGG